MEQTPPANVLATHQRVLELIPKVIAECEGLQPTRDLDIFFDDIGKACADSLAYNKREDINYGLYNTAQEDYLLDVLDRAQRFKAAKAAGDGQGFVEEAVDPEDFYACLAQSQHCSQDQPKLQTPPKAAFPVPTSYHQPASYHQHPPPTYHIPVQAPYLKHNVKINTATRKPRRDQGQQRRKGFFHVVRVELGDFGGFDVRTQAGTVNVRDIICGVGGGCTRSVTNDMAAIRRAEGQWLGENSTPFTACKGRVASTMLTLGAVQELMCKVQIKAPTPSWAAMANTWSRHGVAVVQQLQQALAQT